MLCVCQLKMHHQVSIRGRAFGKISWQAGTLFSRTRKIETVLPVYKRGATNFLPENSPYVFDTEKLSIVGVLILYCCVVLQAELRFLCFGVLTTALNCIRSLSSPLPADNTKNHILHFVCHLLGQISTEN